MNSKVFDVIQGAIYISVGTYLHILYDRWDHDRNKRLVGSSEKPEPLDDLPDDSYCKELVEIANKLKQTNIPVVLEEWSIFELLIVKYVVYDYIQKISE